MTLPRTSKPCTPILNLSNSILQYKEKLQRDSKAPERNKFSTWDQDQDNKQLYVINYNRHTSHDNVQGFLKSNSPLYNYENITYLKVYP